MTLSRTPRRLTSSRHHQLASGHPIQRQQQPTAQLLFHRMVAIAHGGLGGLGHQGLGVAQQQALQHPGTVEFLLQGAAVKPVGVSSGCMTAQLDVVSPPMNSEMPTTPSLPTRPFQPTRRTRSRSGMRRPDRGGRKISVAHLATRFVQHLAQGTGTSSRCEVSGSKSCGRAASRWF